VVDTLRRVKALAYLHPAAMLVVLGLGLYVLREGARIRAARLRRRPFDSRRHRRLARWFVVLAALGFAAGLGSAVWLRGMDPLRSAHASLVGPAVLAFLLAGGLGLRLERRGGLALRRVHLAAGSLGLLAALAGAVAGMAILP
jgi:hypothetical protein